VRSRRREAARFVGCRKSSDCESGEEEVGERKEAGEEGRELEADHLTE
jgi:hypothetical protein